VVTGADAKLMAAYAKIHLFSPDGEDRAYEAGDRIATFTLDALTPALFRRTGQTILTVVAPFTTIRFISLFYAQVAKV